MFLMLLGFMEAATSIFSFKDIFTTCDEKTLEFLNDFDFWP